MYLLPITVPIFKDGDRNLIATDWKRALNLLAASLGGRYGPIGVAAPWRPAADSEQVLVDATQSNDGVELIPTFDARERTRSYWQGAHQQALQVVRDHLPKVQVVHGTAEEPFRPFCYTAFMAGVAARLPTVFVQDQDVASVLRALHRDSGVKRRLVAELEARAHEFQCQRAIKAAGVSFLKGKDTVARYQRFSTNIHPLEDTSYFSNEIVAQNVVQERLQSLLSKGRALRLGFCGRLITIKGVDRSLRIVAQARAAGAKVELHIIGGGPQEDELKALSRTLQLGDAVTFVGAMPYGPALLARLAQCDALLFNPRMEETPRMIFDGYAAGLPLVAGGIAYVQERALADQAAVVLPRDDDDAAAAQVLALDQNRQQVADLTAHALKAAHHHAADRWYARRAQWTHEMVERHRDAVKRG